MNNTNKWESFTKEIGNLIFFWIFGIVFFTIFRATFIFLYNEELGSNINFTDILNTFLMGFRFDATAVGYFIIIPVISTLLLAPWGKFNTIRYIRVTFQYLFVIVSAIICVVTINYYKEYNDQFNMFLFLGLYDDQSAILQTIWKYYHPILNILAMLVIAFSGIYIFFVFSQKHIVADLLSKLKGAPLRAIFIIFILSCTIFTLRGSIVNRPVTRNKAVITLNKLLNKSIINPYRSFIYALSDFKKVSQTSGRNPYDSDWTHLEEVTVSDIIKKQAAGNTIKKPKQIFVVLMEGFDYWTLLDKYSSFNIANNLKELANKGTSFSNFLSSYNATVYAYTTMISGIPYSGINFSRIGANSEPYKSSIFSQFKKLGYTTNTFHGAHFTWENYAVFSEHLGSDKVHNIYEEYKDKSTNIWGADDEEMFEYVLDHVDPNEQTFNFILTLSNHSPFEVDIYGQGFPYKAPQDMSEEAQKVYKGPITMREMGHIWYGDKAIGKFMDVAKEKYPDALFIFTADHTGRRFATPTYNLYEESAIPLIIYGKDIPAQQLKTPGSHIDIMPTLIEMIAPEGFTYYSFGKSMFSEDKNTAFSYEKVMDNDSLYYAPRDSYVHTISLETMQEDKTETFKYKDQYNELMKLAWHYVVRGDSLHLK